jgi:hypothetical protein
VLLLAAPALELGRLKLTKPRFHALISLSKTIPGSCPTYFGLTILAA